MKLKKWNLQRSLRKAMYWALSAFVVAYMLNACGDLLNPEDDEASVSSNSKNDPASVQYIDYGQVGNGGSRNPASTNSSSGGGEAIGISGGTSGGSSSSGGSGGFASAGGALDEGSTGESAERTIAYEDYDGSKFKYFAKMTEPDSAYTYEGKPFALQFVAIGKFPLKYTWYKLTDTGKRVVGTDSTVMSKVSALRSDAGKYYATVEDADGNMLTSRTVALKVRPSDLPCPAGKYGPPNGYNRDQLVQEKYIRSGYRHLVAELKSRPATHIIEVSCSHLYPPMSSCQGELVYQCMGGKYNKIDGHCYCYDDSGG